MTEELAQMGKYLLFDISAASNQVVDIVNSLQHYLDMLTSDIENYLPPFLTFLELPEKDHSMIANERKKR
jgi:hypothetical protein